MLARIKALYPSLRHSEQKVANLVLAEAGRVVNSSIASIAEAAGVSEPTVVRFCRAVGCSGVQDLKLQLAASMASEVPWVSSGVGPDDSVKELTTKVFDRAVATLMQARNHLDDETVARAVDILADAVRIEFYGHGASGVVAQDAQHKFFRLGVPTVAYNDAHTHAMSAGILPPGSVVVAISHTGRSRDLIRSAELALQAGAQVVAITACGSPLAEMSTVALYADVPEDTDTYTPMTSRIVHLTICDILAIGVALRRGPELASVLERTKRNLREKRIPGKDGTG